MNMEKSQKETLIIIDEQNDFNKSHGSLYVKGGEKTEDVIADYIYKNHENISDVVFTVDWHTSNHCSFNRNGGRWPDHCIQYSEGAGISDKILSVCIWYKIPVKIFRKGNSDEFEEYGAFHRIGLVTSHDENGKHVGFNLVANNMSNDSMVKFNTTNFVVCGIAGDFCVKSSIENLLKYKDNSSYNAIFNSINVSVLLDGVASIDDGTTIKEFIKENNLNIVS